MPLLKFGLIFRLIPAPVVYGALGKQWVLTRVEWDEIRDGSRGFGL